MSRALDVGELERDTMPVVTADDSDNVDVIHIGDDAILDQLIGAEQGWLARCRSAVVDGGVAAHALLEPRAETVVLARASRARWKYLDNEDELLAEEAEAPAQVDRRATVELSAARALAELTCALTGGPDIDTAAMLFLDHAERAGLRSAGNTPMPPGPRFTTESGELDRLVRHLLSLESPARGYAVLTALVLAGQKPTALRSTEIKVLFVDAYGAGQVGLLRFTRLAAGPGGLHPDPSVMSFLQADAAFTASLAAAWELSRLAATDACVLWSITTDRGAPVNDVNGGSLGAAFAVALDDLAPTTGWLGRLPRRRLDPACAITAGLDGTSLTEVGGYVGKMLAAQRCSLRVVVAETGFAAATRAAPPGFAHRIALARTVDEAIAQARNRFNYKLWIAAATVVAAAVIGAGLR